METVLNGHFSLLKYSKSNPLLPSMEQETALIFEP